MHDSKIWEAYDYRKKIDFITVLSWSVLSSKMAFESWG